MCLDRTCDARRNHVDERLANAEPIHQLAAREFGNRHDRARSRRRLPRQRPPPDAFPHSEPFGVRDKREVVHGDDGGYPQSPGSGVGRREEHVEMITGRGAGKTHLLPPGAGRAGDQAGRKAARVERDAERLWRVQYELMTSGPAVRGPMVQQAAEVAPDAGDGTAELSRVYADAHCRCSTASWYAS